MKSGLELTSSSAALYVEDNYKYMKSGLELTSSSAALYVNDNYKHLKSGLALTSNSAVLYAKSAENAAEIAARINESTGESEIHLSSDKVYIGNQKSTTVIDGKCTLGDVTANYISGQIATLAQVTVQSLAGSGTLAANYIDGGTIRWRHSAGAGYTYTDLKSACMSSISLVNNGDNTYTLYSYKVDGTATTVGTFERGGGGDLHGYMLGAEWDSSLNPNDCDYQLDSGDCYVFFLEDPQGYAVPNDVVPYVTVGAVGGSSYSHEASITKVNRVYKTSTGVEQDYGKLYYYDAEAKEYKEAASSSKYWYYSNTSIAGTTTVHW